MPKRPVPIKDTDLGGFAKFLGSRFRLASIKVLHKTACGKNDLRIGILRSCQALMFHRSGNQGSLAEKLLEAHSLKQNHY